MKINFVLLIVQNLLIYREIKGLELNSIIDLCDAKDPNLKECMKKATQKFIPIMAKGISEWNMAPMDPLTAPQATFKNANDGDSLELEYKNIVQTGFSSAVIEKVEEVDLTKGIIAFKVRYARISFLADYTSQGKLLDFDIKGQGKANSTFLNTGNDVVIKFHVEADHIKLDSMKFNLNYDKIYLDFPNLIINGDEEISKSVNTFLEDNGEAILAQFKPQTEEFYEKLMTEAVQNLFDNVPYSVLFKNA